MEFLNSYKISFEAIIFVVLISLCWASFAPHIALNDFQAEVLELCDPVDGESEKEESKHKEKKDDKIPIPYKKIKFYCSSPLLKNGHTPGLPSLHHPDIQTPPPEYS